MNNYDASAEKAVLSGLYQYGSNAYTDIADLLTPDSFYLETNQIIYKCLEFLLKDKVNQKIDLASFFYASNSIGVSHILEKEDERKYLRAIINFPIHLENVRGMAKRVRKLQITRNAANLVEGIKSNLLSITGQEPIEYILSLIENPVFDFSLSFNENNEGPQIIGKGIDSYLDYLKNNVVETVGISSGYPLYDSVIGGGFRRKTVNMIGARPKSGKTMLADNIALHVAKKLKIPVLNLDTEMSKEDHWNRMIANISGVSIKDIETGQFSEVETKKIAVEKAAQELREIPYYYISIAGMSFSEIEALMRRWVLKEVGLDDSGLANQCLIIYDYLKLMSSDSINNNLQEYQVLGFQMTGLHNFMVKYGTACLCFIQLNRDGINRESTDVASGSDRIIWLCSNFTIFKNKSEEEIAEEISLTKEKYNCKLVPIVARHGSGLEPGDYINMKMTKHLARIEEGETRNLLHSGSSKGKSNGEIFEIPEEQPVF